MPQESGMEWQTWKNPNLTGFEFVPGLHDVQISVIDFRFLELAFDEAAGEACRIDWRFDIP